MPNRILKERLKLKKGKHTYEYNPSGFDNPINGNYPVLRIDDRTILVDEEPAIS